MSLVHACVTVSAGSVTVAGSSQSVGLGHLKAHDRDVEVGIDVCWRLPAIWMDSIRQGLLDHRRRIDAQGLG